MSTLTGQPPSQPTIQPTSQPISSRASTANFRRGEKPSDVFCSDIAKAYETLVHWRKNIFSPPSGHAGTEYVREHTRLLHAFTNKTPLERVAMQAIMVMSSLLLQKPHGRAGAKEFGKHLERRMVLWKAGKIAELLDEAKTIQSRLPEMDHRNGLTSEKTDQRFATLMSKGEVNTALSLITAHGKGGFYL